MNQNGNTDTVELNYRSGSVVVDCTDITIGMEKFANELPEILTNW